MQVRALAAIVVLGIAFAGNAAADEIVYFTNGTAMAIRSHKLENDMIRVDLGNNSAMAFPVSMVEKVESAGRNVFQNSTFGTANQAVGPVGTSGGGTHQAADAQGAVTGYATMPSRNRQSASARRRERMDPEDQLAAAAQGNPAPAEVSAGPTTAARRVRVMGRTNGGPGEDGTFQRGGLTVLGAPGIPNDPQTGSATRKPIVAFGPKATQPDEPPEPTPEADEPVEGSDDPGDPDNAQTPPE